MREILISNTVRENRCAGCALEDLKDKRYVLFRGVSRDDIYVFCPICAKGHLRGDLKARIHNPYDPPVEVTEEFVTVAMVMGT